MPGEPRVTEFEIAAGTWRFASAAPCAPLADVVVEYWEVEGRLLPFREKIVPNGCLEVMFNLGPPHQMLMEGDTSTWDTAWLSSVHESAITIESLHGTHLVSARLKPLGALRLLDVTLPATNTVVPLEAVFGDAALTVREQLLQATSTDARFALIEALLLDGLSPDPRSSAHVRDLARRIEQQHGNLRISELHRDYGVSRKHLWSLFKREMGLTPKAYGNLQRFIWTHAFLRERASVDWAQLALEAGYSDQSHLARDFRRVAHASPTEFLRTRTPDNTATLEEIG